MTNKKFMLGIDGIGGIQVTVGRHCFVGIAVHWLTAVGIVALAATAWYFIQH